jgi:hypothetical protein
MLRKILTAYIVPRLIAYAGRRFGRARGRDRA